MASTSTPSKRNRSSETKRALLGAVLGASFTLLTIDWIESYIRYVRASPLAGWQYFLYLAVGFLTMRLLITAVHEGGHFLAAYLLKFRCLTYVVAWLYVERKGARWQVRLKRKPGKIMGYVRAVPAAGPHLQRGLAIYFLGGILANIVTGSAALLAGKALADSQIFAASPALAFVLVQALYLFGGLSIFIGLANLIPFTTPTKHTSDGGYVLRLLRGGASLQRQLALYTLSSVSHAGTRPRNWDAEVVKQLLTAPDGSSFDCTSHFYTYLYHLDNQDFTQAEFHLGKALGLLPLTTAEVQQQLCCEATYFAATHTHDVAQAELWLAKAQQIKPFEAEEGLLAQATVAGATGNDAAARKWLAALSGQLADINDLASQLLLSERIATQQLELNRRAVLQA
ncbi:M50 family metallopeptidase [Hymenobacter sp. BT491]|uniref:M50 family metallopeptidase n=1 Tax=Hymenobacter sp. BT491 TaxID=2766779 RepID=UPI001653D717|nr:M50 family metallopeptidase [Hymenobacter sp. BT491]MBC6991975.1 M50 family metallopeptidase [Hymenobacter sp. BT491]